ncbi:MAG: hypothetical protein CMP08_02700 [Xanthomonadales bacterium]|nr:hypothetical protein [Xanthomonadales bacterium]
MVNQPIADSKAGAPLGIVDPAGRVRGVGPVSTRPGGSEPPGTAASPPETLQARPCRAPVVEIGLKAR